MQIVTIGDNLLEMPNLFSGKVRKIFQMSSADNFIKRAKR